MTGFRQDLRFASRALMRQPLFTLTAVLILGLALAATVAIYTVVDNVILRPLPYAAPERLVLIQESTPQGGPFAVAPANFVDWQELSRSFGVMAAVRGQSMTVAAAREPIVIQGLRVSPAYFETLGVSPRLGRGFVAEDAAALEGPVVVLSHELWQSRFGGDAELLGRTIPLSDVPHTVIGIMPPRFAAYGVFVDGAAQYWTPNVFAADPPTERMARRLQVVARLADGVTVEQAGAEMAAIAAGLAERYPESNEDWGAQVVPLHDAVLAKLRRTSEGVAVGSHRGAFLMVLAAAGFVLLIACANLATLLLARDAGRRREIAVRAALGAGRARVVRFLLTESALLAGFGLIAGVALALAALPVLLGLAPDALPRLAEVRFDARVAAISVAIAISATLMFGLIPALQASRRDIRSELVGGSRGAGGGRSRTAGRQALVIAEVALSIVLLAGAGLMLNSFRNLRGTDIGVAADGLVIAEFTTRVARYAVQDGTGSRPYTAEFTRWRVLPDRMQFVDDVLTRVAAVPAVSGAAIIDTPPGSGWSWGGQFSIEGRPQEDGQPPLGGTVSFVTPGYFDVVGTPLRRGRDFTAADRAGAPEVALISESMARRFWPDADPLGARLHLADGVEDEERVWEIVGVVGDSRASATADARNVHIYLPQAQRATHFTDWQISFPNRTSVLARTAGATGPAVAGIREAIWAVSPDQPINWIGPMTRYVYRDPQMAEQRFYTVLVALLGGLSLVLAVAGLYGVISHMAAQRRYEIGVRMALGARTDQVLLLVLRQSLTLVAAGVVLGLAAAATLTRVLESWLYGIDARDPATLAGTAALLVATALLASQVPAWRAARTDPMHALRSD
jgi:putative ABC transport system permease protein